MTQALPANDTFDEGATHYGAHCTGWINVSPWTTAGDTVSGYTIPCPPASLHSGYSAGTSYTAASRSAGSATASDLGSYVWRAYYSNDARITHTFRLYTRGAVTTDSPRFVGVCGRVSGGSYVETTGSESIRDCTGYWFVLTNTAALGPKWQLLRVNTGVVTLVTAAVTATFPNGLINDLALACAMSMSVDDDGSGNPVLVCRATIDGVQTVIFNVTDSSGSKITAAGRWGICLGKDRQESSNTIRSAMLSVQAAILDIGTLSFVLVDEWYRGSSLNVGASITDGLPVTGRCLQPTWRGDHRSSQTKSNQRDASQNRIMADSVGLPGDCISARPSPNIWDHHRSAVFNVTNSGSVAMAWGLKLRGTLNGVGTFVSGWFFEIQHSVSGAGVFDAYLYRVSSAGGLTQLAHAFAPGGMTLGVNHTLDMHVYNSGPGGQFSGTPTLICKIGATVVNWISDTSAVDIDAGYTVRYIGSSPPLSGESEGMYISGGASGTRFVKADTWTQQALAEAVVAADDQATFALLAESAGATGTFTTPDFWPITQTTNIASIDHPYDSGHVNSISIQATGRRTWEIAADAITDDERDDLIDFIDDHKGVEIPFSWVEPRGTTITARFIDDSLADRLRDVGVHAYSIAIEECLT